MDGKGRRNWRRKQLSDLRKRPCIDNAVATDKKTNNKDNITNHIGYSNVDNSFNNSNTVNTGHVESIETKYGADYRSGINSNTGNYNTNSLSRSGDADYDCDGILGFFVFFVLPAWVFLDFLIGFNDIFSVTRGPSASLSEFLQVVHTLVISMTLLSIALSINRPRCMVMIALLVSIPAISMVALAKLWHNF